MTDAAVVIPIYKNSLSENEEISLERCFRILGRHMIIFAAPEGLDISGITSRWTSLYPQARTGTERFGIKYFDGIRAYNRLVLSEDFYRRFEEYRYILIYQTDAFVFRDELDLWCGKGYDYIGAPWLPLNRKYENPLRKMWLKTYRHLYRGKNAAHHKFHLYEVGNGGFSLRKVKKFIDITHKYREQIDRQLADDAEFYPEDLWLLLELKGKDRLRKPSYREAAQFAAECRPEWAMRINHGRLPFGCHAWYHRLYADFWEKIILTKAWTESAPDSPVRMRPETGEKDTGGGRPAVSVIIPAYNAETCIRRCLESVLTQTYREMDVIIINDGSTDGTDSIVREYADKDTRIRYFVQENSGTAATRERGINTATGKYIQFLDADDTFRDRDTICRLVMAAEENDADMVLSPFIRRDEANPDKDRLSEIPDKEKMSGTDCLKYMLEGKAYWAVWTKFHRRSLYAPHMSFPAITLGEDVIISTQTAMRAKNIIAVRYPSVDYHICPSSVTMQIDDRKYGDFRIYLQWLYTFIESNNLREILGEKTLAHFHLINTMMRMHWKRLDGFGQDMEKVVRDIGRYPELCRNLSRRERRIVMTWKHSSAAGRLLMRHYMKRRKI